MDFHTINFRLQLYNTTGDTTKDFSSVVFSLIYLCFLGYWVSTCRKNQTHVHRIHILIGALLLTATLDWIFGPADSQYGKMTSTGDGSEYDVVFYAFKCLRVALFYTVIVLMCAGWSFLRPSLRPRETVVLVIVIVYNVGSSLIREINPFDMERTDLYFWFFVVDLSRQYIFLSITVWTSRWLDKVCKADGKAARSFAKIRKFTWVDEAPAFGFVYIHYWNFATIFVKYIQDQLYDDMTANVMEEIARLVFCMVLFYKFRPDVKNDCCFPEEDEEEDDEEEEASECKTGETDRIHGQKRRKRRGKRNKNPDQVSFSYPSLPEDFEW